MTEVGVLPEDATIELIDGDVVDAAPISPLHAYCTTRLMYLLHERLGEEAGSVRVRGPIHIDDYNEPNPDLVIARFRADHYREAHPVPEEVSLLVEVADASLTFDREVKLPLYASACIPEFWLIDLPSNRVAVYRQPLGNDFSACANYEPGRSFSPLAFPELRIAVEEIVGYHDRPAGLEL